MNLTVFPSIPLDTVMAAQAVFGGNHSYLVIGDRFNDLFTGLNLMGNLAASQKQVHMLATLYLITVFQHMECLPDQLAVDAVRERLDWKYALHFPLNPAPIEASRLCEFRKALSGDQASQQNLQKLIERLVEIHQIALCQCLRQDTDQLVWHVCRISRLANLWETINQSIEVLATSYPLWLRKNSLPHWYERYSHTRRHLNLQINRDEQESFAQAVGSDGYYLLEAIQGSEMPELADLPEVRMLQKVWHEQFEHQAGNVIWRTGACAGCSFAYRV